MMKESITYEELKQYLRDCIKSIHALEAINADPNIVQAVYQKLQAGVTIADDLFLREGNCDSDKASK